MSSVSSHSPEKKDSDFFMEHTQVSVYKGCFSRLFLTGGLLTRPRPCVIMSLEFFSLSVIPHSSEKECLGLTTG